MGLLPGFARLLVVVLIILALQATTNPTAIATGLCVSILLLALNLRLQFKIVIVTSVAITFVSIFLGNVAFPASPCPAFLGNSAWIDRAHLLFGKCGFDAGITFATRRVAMILIGYAWLNSSHLSEAAGMASSLFGATTRYPYRAMAMAPFALARRMIAEYSTASRSLAIRISRRPPGFLNRMLQRVYITFLKLSATILRLFSNTPKVAFAIALHGGTNKKYQDFVDIRIEHLSVSYAEKLVLRDISFSAVSGDVVFVDGEPQSGKTTLLRAITRYIPQVAGAVAGSIQVNGENWSDPSLGLIETLPNMRVLTEDTHEQFIGVTVGQELLFHAPRQSAEHVLNDMGMTGFWFRDIDTLSGGERVRLALACILASRSKFLVLDNPLSQLDPEAREMFIRALSRYLQDEKPLVIVTDRYPDEFVGIATRYAEIVDGKLLERDISSIPQFLARAVNGIEVLRSARHIKTTEVVAALKNAQVSIAGQDVFRELSFEIRKGEVITIFGPNGSGKTTAMLALAGAIPLNSGVVVGSDGVGVSFQNPSTQFLRLELRDELDLKGWLMRQAVSERIAFASRELEWLGVSATVAVPDLGAPDERRLSISSMLYKTAVLVIDEPDIELGGQNVHNLLNRINELSNNDVAVIIISHSPVFKLFADRCVDFAEYGRCV